MFAELGLVQARGFLARVLRKVDLVIDEFDRRFVFWGPPVVGGLRRGRLFRTVLLLQQPEVPSISTGTERYNLPPDRRTMLSKS